LVAGNYNSANLGSGNYRTDVATESPFGDYEDGNFDNVAFRTGGLTRAFTISDTALGDDEGSWFRTLTVSDSGTGIETSVWVLWGNFAEINFELSNFWAHGGTHASTIGSYSFSNFYSVNFWCDGDYIFSTDIGYGTDVIRSPIVVVVLDYVFGVDIPYRVQGELSLDAVPLPHVQLVKILEKTVIKTSPISGDLPVRRQIGKMGREITVDGWADSLSSLEQIKNFADGEDHVLMLPTGDGLVVHVTESDPFRTPEDEAAGIYRYSLSLMERVDVV